MIVIDTSAIVAILFQEEDAYSYAEKIQQSEMCFMSAATLVELCAVLKKKKDKEYVDVVYSFIKESGIKIEPFSYCSGESNQLAYGVHGIACRSDFGSDLCIGHRSP